MALRSLIIGLLVWGLYPAWLLAGAVDYMCHRRSDIAHTSGATESWLHVGQLVTIMLAFGFAVLFEVTVTVLIVMFAAVMAHSILSFVDVSYTQGRRYISPLEQHAHGFMEVLPLVAACLVAALGWGEIQAQDPPGTAFRMKGSAFEAGRLALMGSLVVLAGIPVIEELLRTLRARSNEERHR